MLAFGVYPKINHVHSFPKLQSCLYVVLIPVTLFTKTIVQTENRKEAMTEYKLTPLANPRQKMLLEYFTE